MTERKNERERLGLFTYGSLFGFSPVQMCFKNHVAVREFDSNFANPFVFNIYEKSKSFKYVPVTVQWYETISEKGY